MKVVIGPAIALCFMQDQPRYIGVTAMSWFTCKQFGPTGRIEAFVSIRANNERGARVIMGRLFHCGLASHVSVTWTKEA